MLDEVCAVAVKEYSLQEEAVDNMEEEWANQFFGLKAYKKKQVLIF